MAKKQNQESQVDQSARFRAEVERLIAAGELSPTEADERFDRVLKTAAPARVHTRPKSAEK